MAQATYRTSSSVSGTGTSLVIPKPSGLVAGDLMVAQIALDTATLITVTPPTNWITDTSNVALMTFHKLADSTDAAATNFLFTLASNALFIANMHRVTVPPGTIVDQKSSTENDVASLTTTGITPTYSNSFLMIMTGWAATATRSVSGYAIATTNPTWTENVDVLVTSGDSVGLSLATANRNIFTSTGAATATVSGTVLKSAIAILNVVPPVSSSVQMTATAIRPDSIRVALNVLASMQVVVVTPIITILTKTWNNLDKSLSSWVNQDKS